MMSTDLTLLVWAVALTFAQGLIAAFGASFQVGLPALAGNREALPEITGWAGADFFAAGVIVLS
jgi:hypothetical protein